MATRHDKSRAAALPRAVKIVYTLFLCILVPAYWREYGFAHFLWFSDIALFLGLLALWLESRLLASTMAVSVLFLEITWNLDYFARLLLGFHVTTLSGYMFDEEIPRFIRGLSFFHVPMPFFIVWLLRRLGYDSRALAAQTALALIVIPLSYAVTRPTENVNWARGLGRAQRQILPTPLWLLLLMVVYPVGVYLPTHAVLKRLFAPGRRWGTEDLNRDNNRRHNDMTAPERVRRHVRP